MKASFGMVAGALASLALAQAFVVLPSPMVHASRRTSSSRSMMMRAEQESTKGSSTTSSSSGSSRMGYLQRAAVQATGLGLVVGAAPFFTSPQPAQAASLSKINSELAGYGLPPIVNVPGGFSPLVEVYGKVAGAKKERETLLVQFFYPSLWVVSKPSIDKNGEEGTISAGDYQKGDSAAFFVGEGPSSGKLDDQPDSYFGDVVTRAIGQKSTNVYQNFKVLKKRPGAKGSNGAQYYIIEFKYELLTGAGFTVDRKGVASVTQVGKSVQALWTAATAQRYKKIGEDLTVMCESFRVYNGIAPA